MDNHDDAARACADRDPLALLRAETERAMNERPGPLRQLRLECLLEKSQALQAPLADGPTAPLR